MKQYLASTTIEDPTRLERIQPEKPLLKPYAVRHTELLWNKMAIDALVESITTYRSLPLWAHVYAAPFGIIYACWFYIWISIYGFDEYYELGLIGGAIIGLIQALLILFCHWFVGVKCAFSCVQESDPRKATHCKVVPTPNNGWSELVPLRRTQRAGKNKVVV
ncbi:hypothetical protein KIN20_022715 [Parelaphostrongylus tenuis]|uniref:P5A-ATPase transmembrane helical hairpin domain-containing protein n=1 Tax=Parelaphostrongylus tenuis TaxID=148309 RepID=A0AAD5N9C0_PARTN|nr:hypothetical protein KIN20_022715 [Parelaphostrongylus tenuis]